MDKFDTTIKDARPAYEPKNNFVENTMEEIAQIQKTPKKGLSFWMPITASGVIVLTLVFIGLSAARSNNQSAKHATSTVNQTANSSTKSDGTTPSAGTDDASLASSLSDVQTAQNQEGSDQNSANTALNDNSQQITVPTD